MKQHTPVYLEEVLEALDVQAGKRYIDATYGEGGHTKEIVAKGARVLALDWDEEQIKRGREQFKNQEVEFVHANFANIADLAKKNNFDQVDGVLFDLGLSYGQLTGSAKGLSYMQLNDELDMRLTSDADQTAAEMLRLGTVEELYDIFASNSELVQAKQLALQIVEDRKERKIRTVGDLIHSLKMIPVDNQKRLYSQVFQALRIAVNNETESIRRGLEGAASIVKKGGKIVVITFQSREDRIVKLFGVKSKNMFKMDKIKKRDARSFERSATVRVLTKLID